MDRQPLTPFEILKLAGFPERLAITTVLVWVMQNDLQVLAGALARRELQRWPPIQECFQEELPEAMDRIRQLLKEQRVNVPWYWTALFRHYILEEW